MAKAINGRRSNMPAMVDRIVIETPIFSYLDLVARHRAGHPGTSRPPRRLDGLDRRLVDFARSLEGRAPATCWTGTCPGCGRGLVSATTETHASPSAFFCTRACRAAHGG